VVLNAIVFWFTFVTLDINIRLLIGSIVVVAVCSVSPPIYGAPKACAAFALSACYSGCLSLRRHCPARSIALLGQPRVTDYLQPPSSRRDRSV